MRFGLHVSIAGGIARSVERANALGCDCFQIFITNPRSWNENQLASGQADAFRVAREEAGLTPVVVHLSYLPNPASPDRERWKRSCKHIALQYEDAKRIGADFLVLHPGSTRGGSHANGCKRVADALRRTVDAVSDGPTLLLENTAGQGSALGASPEQLAEIVSLADLDDAVAICFDTAHAAAAGVNISIPGGMRAMRERIRKVFGYDPIKLIHFNDLKTKIGSAHDVHANLGEGSIGAEGLRDILHAPGVADIPFILETPVDKDGDDLRNLECARRLAE